VVNHFEMNKKSLGGIAGSRIQPVRWRLKTISFCLRFG
jgi:hypothetical protein